MKKKIILIVLIILLGLIAIGYLIYPKVMDYVQKYINKESTITESTNSSSASNSSVDWTNYKSYEIKLNNTSQSITEAGVYHITGSIDNGSISINTDDNVKIILDNIIITNSNGPAINVENAKNAYIELVGKNVLSSTVSGEEDSVIYSHDDLFFEGDGSITITSNLDGISSNDDLTIYSGTFNITATDDGIKGKDSVTVENGTFNVNAKGNGIKTTNETEKGNIIINNGVFNITSVLDGIQSINTLTINNGTFNIKTTSTSTTESAKAIKATNEIIINNGTYTLTTTDDSIHSNKDVTIKDGKFTIVSDDDGIHADGKVEINGGSYIIDAGEAIEATYVKINDGDINITATDDGINATSKSTLYDVILEINGGNITIKMAQGDTDALDSNGNLYITGGTINITAQSPFDYDGQAKYTGGTITVNGEKVTSITNQMMGGMGGPMANQGRR